jgi:hypothetical protein
MKKTILICILLFVFDFCLQAQTKDEKTVENAVEQLRLAMVDANKVALENLVSENLSYGHSGGHVDDKNAFIEELVSGKSDFAGIELSAQTISIHKKVAIVRHSLDAMVNDGNNPHEVHLLVLLVWQKEHGQWKLLARQAVKK